MTLQERLDADMRSQLRSRYRALPVIVPEVMGEPVERPVPWVQGRPHPVVSRPFPPLPVPPPAPSVEFKDVVDAVAEAWNIKPCDMLSKRQTQWCVRSRQAAYLLLRRHTKYSLPAIAVLMKRNDHTTVLSGLRRAQRLIEGDVDWRRRFEIAENMLVKVNV